MNREQKATLKALHGRLEAIHTEAESIKDELQTLFEGLEDAFNAHSETWQEGPSGEKAQGELDQVGDILNEAETAAEALESACNSAEELA